MVTTDVRPESTARRRRIDITCAAFGWIALYLLLGAVLQWLYGSPAGPGELSRWQGIGMLVLLPLALTALAAAIIGFKNAFVLMRTWREEPGLFILPLLLLVLFGAFLLHEADRLPRMALVLAAAIYVVAALLFALRWFLSGRRRYPS